MLALDGKINVRCTRQRAWDLFSRFGEIAALIPSVQEVEVDGDTVHARMETKLGALPVSSRVTLEVVERVPLRRIRAEGWSYLGETITEQVKQLKGIQRESAGRLDLKLELHDGDEPGTIALTYSGEVDAKGRLKRIYKAILKSKAPEMLEQFAVNLREALEVEAEPLVPDPGGHPGPDDPSFIAEPKGSAQVDHPGDAAVAMEAVLTWFQLVHELWQRLLVWVRGLLRPDELSAT